MKPPLWERLFGYTLDFRARIFNMLGLLGIVSGLLVSLLNAVNNTGLLHILSNLFASVLAFGLMWFANRTGKFKLCFRLTAAIVFMVLFPILFFTGGGFHGGMPVFFLFGVVFTAMMLEGRWRIWFVLSEIALYAACFFLALLRPETVTALSSEQAVMTDIAACCIIASAVLAFAIHQHLIVYDQKQKQLERLDRERTELFGSVSHQMKTPLAVISAHAQLMKSKLELRPDADGLVENTLFIISQTNQLGMMVSQALTLAQIAETGLVRDPKPCHIGEIVTRAVSAHFSGSPALTRHNRIDLKIGEGLPPVLADAPRIEQVVVNLLSNAVRHTENGTITLSVTCQGKQIALEVKDNGKGMTREETMQIFERWYTTDGEHGTGTGLGLHICEQIVRAHGGKIAVKSEVGRGSVFTVYLPVA